MPKRKISTKCFQPNQNESDEFQDSDGSTNRGKRIKTIEYSESSITIQERNFAREEILQIATHATSSSEEEEQPLESTHLDGPRSDEDNWAEEDEERRDEENLGEGEEEVTNFDLCLQNNKSQQQRKSVNSGAYDGFASFMKSFNLFSEDDADAEEDEDGTSQKSDHSLNDQVSENNHPHESSAPPDSPPAQINEASNSVERLTPRAKKEKKRSQIIIKEDNTPMVKIHKGEVITVNYPSRIKLYGHLKVTLISGKVSINGYELIASKTVDVFSQKQSGYISVVTHMFDISAVTFACAIQAFEMTLSVIDQKILKPFVKENCVPSTVVLLIEKVHLPPPLVFLRLYADEAASPFLRKRYETDSSPIIEDIYELTFTKDYETLFAKIQRHLYRINKGNSAGYIGQQCSIADLSSTEPNLIEKMIGDESDMEDVLHQSDEEILDDASSVEEELTGSRILICGPKKSGKSTMLRYLINKFLNLYQEVFYLDTDPGQTEFTPPGTVSLTKVTEPVLGPAYTHLRKPEKMIFIGTVTAETSPPMHYRSIKVLIDYFNLHFPKSILLVNTMGWITGLGSDISQVIKKNVKPTVVIELEAANLALSTIVQKEVMTLNVGFHRDHHTSNSKGDAQAFILRDYSLLTYLGQCQQFFMPATYINEMRTVNVSWDDLHIYSFNKRLPYNRYIESLNLSIVALCRVDECYLLMSADDAYPNTLDDEPNNDCLGFGLVRAIDEENHMLYIVTPVDLNTLSKVNAIITGNILVPKSLILNQPLNDTDYFYTDDSKRTSVRKPVKRRIRRNTSIFA